MSIIVDPEYVDALADSLSTLTLEVEQAKAAVAEGTKAHAASEQFQLAVQTHTDYWQKRAVLSDRVKEIAQRFGTYCREDDSLILVGSRWVIRSKNGDITVIVCETPEGARQQQQDSASS